jgi:hypothetical protein
MTTAETATKASKLWSTEEVSRPDPR